MALKKNRNAVVITDSDGDKFEFVYGVNARRDIKKRTNLKPLDAIRKAFSISVETVKNEQTGEDEEKVNALPEREWDMDLVCTLVSCCSVSPVLSEDDAGVLIQDVSVLPILDIFQMKGGDANPSTTPS